MSGSEKHDGSDIDNRHSDYGSGDRIPAFGTPQDITLNAHILSIGYAVGIVVLSIGIVILTVTLAVLCFMYPDKANAFMVLLASPIAALVLANTFRVTKLIQDVKQVKELSNGNGHGSTGGR